MSKNFEMIDMLITNNTYAMRNKKQSFLGWEVLMKAWLLFSVLFSCMSVSGQGTGAPATLAPGVIFHETFGTGTVRYKSPYTVTGANSFIFADPNTPDNPATVNPNGPNSDDKFNERYNAQRIENNHYAVVAPKAIYNSVFSGFIPENNYKVWSSLELMADATGDTDGAAMIINAGITLNSFYKRPVTLQSGKYYKLSYKYFVENPTVNVKLVIYQKGKKTPLATMESGNLQKNSSWTEMNKYFSIPAGCSITDFDISLDNNISNPGGNDYAIDEIVLTELPAGTPHTDNVVLDCISQSPTAGDDEGTGNPGAVITVPVLTNDKLANNDPAVPSNVSIQVNVPANGVKNQWANEITVPGEGVWTWTNTNIIFTPVSGFNGNPTPITYNIKENTSGAVSNDATVTIKYLGAPVATDDNDTMQTGEPKIINILTNDESVSETPATPANVTVSLYNTFGSASANPNEVVVAGEGTWIYNPANGELTFTPVTGFTADPTPISYTIKDNANNLISGRAHVKLTVGGSTPQPTDCSPSGATTVDLNSMFTGTVPAGTQLVWYTTNNHSAGTEVSDPTQVESGTYYAFFVDAANNCFNTDLSTARVDVTILPPCNADVEITKAVDNPTPKVGENVVFTLTVTNNGPGIAEDVKVSDLLPTGYAFIEDNASGAYTSSSGEWFIGNMANADVAVLRITAQVLPTGDYSNTATVTSSTPDNTPGNNTDTSTPVPVPQADLSITKMVDNPTPEVGENAVFTLTVTNAGPSSAEAVVVTDKLPAGYTFVSVSPAQTDYVPETGKWTVGLLPVGTASITITATVNTPTGTVDEYKNTATVVSTTDDPTPNTPGEATPDIPYLTFVKTAVITTDNNTNGKADKDDVITYTFTVRNTGNVTLEEVTLTDAKITETVSWTVDGTAWDPATGSLAVGKAAIGKATYTVKQSDIDAGGVWNQATVNAKDPNNAPLDPTPSTDDPLNPGKPGDKPFDPNDPNDPDHRTEVPANQVSDLSFVKTAVITTDNNTNGKADRDDIITYTFTVRNTGNTTLNSVTIADPMSGLSSLTYTWPVPSSVGVLAPGQSVTATATYTVKQSDVDAGKVSNQATVGANDPNGDPLDPTPSTDDPSNPGKPGDPVDPTDRTEVPANQVSDLSFVKTAVITTDNNTNGKADRDDIITYTFTVRNTGNTTLNSVTIADPMSGLSSLTYTWPVLSSVGVLAPGQSVTATATYTVKQSDVDAGKVSNQATVGANDPNGDPLDPTPSTDDPSNPGKPGDPVDPTDRTEVPANQVSDLSFVKTAVITTDNNTNGKADRDDIITYTFTVRNTGNTTLNSVTIADPMSGLSSLTYTWPVPSSVGVLAPGQSVTATTTYTVKQSDVDAGKVSNQATAGANDPNGDPLDPTPSTDDPSNPGKPGDPGDPTVVEADNTPSYTLVKGAKLTTDKGTVGKADVDDVITYTFTVKNTGKVTLKNVTVSDPLANLSTISPASVTSLDPGASAIFTATYTVVQTDVNRGSVENVATVNGNGPDGKTTVPPVESIPEDPNNPGTPDPGKTPGDPTIVDADNTPSYTLVKGAKLTTDKGTVGKADVDDVITYTFTVKNTGKVTLKNVTVSDPLANLSTISPASVTSLDPGASVTFTATYTVVQTDVDRGSVENVATVKGNGPDGTTTVPPVESTPEDPNNPGTPDPGKTPGDPTIVEADDAGELKVVKTSLPVAGFLHAGDKIEYLIEVTNTGKVTLFDVVVTDANADVKNVGTIAKLEVGKTVQLTAFHTITQADMIKGFVSNIAKAEGKDPKGNPVTGESTSGNTPKPGDPTDPNCTDCTITPLPWVPIEAVVDTPPAINGKDGGKTPSVLDNDKLNNKLVDPKDVTVTVEKPADPKTPGAPVPTLDPKTGIVTVDPETPAGEYKITYKICEVLNPSNCSTTTVTIVVEAPLIEAVIDTPPAINGKDGGKTPNVLDNDKLNNKPVDPKDVTVTVEKPADPKTPGAPVPRLDPKTGIVTVDPETPAGSYEITYKICEVLNPGNCSTTTVTIVVEPAPIEAVVDTPPAINGKDGGKTPNVLDNDKLNNKPVDPKDVTVTVEKPADPKTPGAPVPTLDPKTGIVTVDPETPAGSYEITYKICEVLNPKNCSTVVVKVVVAPAPIVTVDDPIKLEWSKEEVTTESVLKNDSYNGKPIDLTEVTLLPGAPSNPGLSMNPDGTINIAPSTRPGTYTYPYTICEILNPTNCSTAVATIVIEASNVFIPNTFTPNGDGVNDKFEIVGIENFDRVSLTIVNRWGNEVYRNDSYKNEWNGSGLNEGTYYYIVTLRKGTTETVHKGWVLIKTR